jgi:hypothetical protein
MNQDAGKKAFSSITPSLTLLRRRERGLEENLKYLWLGFLCEVQVECAVK